MFVRVCSTRSYNGTSKTFCCCRSGRCISLCLHLEKVPAGTQYCQTAVQCNTVLHKKQCAVAGLGVASACAFILKRFQLAPGADSRQGGPAFNATIYEVALVVMSAYLAYLVSETLALSGIVTLFFTGICHAHYSYYSVTKEAAITLKRLFEFAAFLSEMFVFAYLGLQVSHTSSSSSFASICGFAFV